MSEQPIPSSSGDERAGVPVVGIVASAGDPAATAAVLGALEDNPNLSIVVLQHLSSEHDSAALVSLLQRSTHLPVVPAPDGTRLEANRVYVAPSTSAVVLQRDGLKLISRSKVVGLQVAKEEITYDNEELRSTNEELQVAKEQLQATNHELLAINDEMTARSEEANRRADDLTNVLNSVEVPVLLLDREAKIRRFTPAAAVLFELEAEDVGRELKGLRRPFVADCSEMARQVLRDFQPVARTVQGADGRWQLFHARPYVTLEKRIEGSIISAFDVDAVAGTTFRDLLAGAGEGILMIAASGRIVFANEAGATLFGYAPDELVGLELETLLPADKRVEHRSDRARYATAASARTMAGTRSVFGLRRDGKTIPLEVTLNPTRGQHGEVVIAFVRDITERRKAELEIQTYQSRLQHMAFDAAVAEERERRRIAVHLHDQIGQGMALARIKLSEARDSTSGSAREAIDDAMLLLAQSLESTRNVTFDLSPPILYDLGLKEALSWLAEDLEGRFGLRVKLRMDTLPAPLDDASAALVFRAVRELLINVIKHAQLPEAELRVECTNDSVNIRVQDYGVGFDASAPRSGSAGFGLMSVREQIVRLGGWLNVASTPGQGACISLSVPLVAASSS
ncbi:MAG TPA: PAS domain S-box protein [Polyangiaceae bacterium]|nr:PAS domain S-box protein [Polyangiaceae bacterium]